MLQVEISCDDSELYASLTIVTDVLREAYAELPDRPGGEWAVTVRLARSEEISHLHAMFFGDPTDTDVMSFPSGDDLASVDGYLGDIAISLDVAAVQAAEQGHTLTREVAFLALHGLLHLLGHDDASESERTAMLDRQAQLLSSYEAKHGTLR